MSFRVVKQTDIRPKYCDYIQRKIDAAERNGAVYDLNDEDLRIQKLYEDTNLRNEEQVRELSRVRLPDGSEKLVASKRVNFYDVNTGAQKDSYVFIEGRQEEPIVTMNERGEQVANQSRYVYSIDYDPSKVDDFLQQNGSAVQLSYYDGPVSAGRTEPKHILIGNVQTFKDAKWEELLYGTELKNISSMVNPLTQIRQKMNGGVDPTVGVQNISPLSGQIGYSVVHTADTNAVANHQTELGPAQIEEQQEAKNRPVQNVEGVPSVKQEDKVANTQEQLRTLNNKDEAQKVDIKSNKAEELALALSKAEQNKSDEKPKEDIKPSSRRDGKSSK